MSGATGIGHMPKSQRQARGFREGRAGRVCARLLRFGRNHARGRIVQGFRKLWSLLGDHAFEGRGASQSVECVAGIIDGRVNVARDLRSEAGIVRLATRLTRHNRFNSRLDLAEAVACWRRNIAHKSIADLDDEIRSNIASRPTKFASDNEFIVSFIDEISRNKETAAAVKGRGPMPVGNWVHPFTRFSDIRDVLDPLILNGLSVRHAAGRKALQNQLLTLLRDVVPIIKDKAMIPAPTILKLAKEIDLKTDDLTGSVRLPDQIFNRLIFLAMIAPNTTLSEAGLEAALGSDLLLEYVPAEGNFKQTPAYDLLTELLDQIRKLEKARTGFNLNEIIVRGSPRNRGADKSVTVPTHLVAGVLHILFRWADIATLAKALAQALDGKPLVAPQRMPITPFREQEEELKREQASLEQIRTFVGLKTSDPAGE